MIAINDYRQFVAELVAAAAQQSEVEVKKIRLAVTESQLVSLLKDQQGVVVAGNIPGAEISNNGYWLSSGECLLMVLEKMPDDQQGTDKEFDNYARLQRLMAAIIRLLTGENFQEFCDKGEVDRSQGFTIEWEYNYAGFNGLSIAFRLKDKNGTSLQNEE